MNYWEYIRVEELLGLQGGYDGDEATMGNDEVLFIVVHQVYELWFKLVLRELTCARDLFNQNPVPDKAMADAVRSLRRVVTIFGQAVNHFQVMETMTTRDYLEFRDRLIPASGFQSAQMREIEILLGLDDAMRIPLGREGSYKEALRTVDGQASPATVRVERRLADGPTLKSVLYAWLERTPIGGRTTSEADVDRFIEELVAGHRKEAASRLALALEHPLTEADRGRLEERYRNETALAEAFLRGEDEPGRSAEERVKSKRVRAALVFLESYRELPRLTWPREVVSAVLEMEQAMVVWRQRHARMVERIIGRRTGTGGSAGVDYLDQTALRYRVFGDLWAVRTLLLPKRSVPTLGNADDYRFRIED